MNKITPVRRIPRKNRSLSGEVSIPRLKKIVSYESGLERDFVFLNAIDPDVSDIISQPCRIEFVDNDGKSRSYTPDYLIIFSSTAKLPQLIEIKYAEELHEKAAELAPKFAAAHQYAAQEGWNFSAQNEYDIRSDRLENAKRLVPLQARQPNSGLVARICKAFTKPTQMGDLFDQIELEGTERARGLSTILTLIAQYKITTDLDKPLNQSSIISLTGKGLQDE